MDNQSSPGSTILSPLGGLQGYLDRFFVRMARFSIKHPWLIILSAIILLAVGFVGAGKVQQDNSLDSYFNESDQSFANYKNYIEEFSSDEVIYLLYAAPEKEHGPFDMEVMKKIDHLSKALEGEIPFMRKVTSLSNVEFMQADGDDVIIQAMLEDFPETQEELLRYRDIALSKPLYVDTLISKDAKYAGLIVEMTRTSTDPLEKLRLDPEGGDGLDNLYPQAPNNKLEEILARPEYQGITFWASGDVPMNATYNEVINDDIGKMGLANILILIPLCMLFVQKRLLGAFAPVSVVLLSLVLIVGLMGWVGWSINLFFMMIPALIIAVGVAQAIHVILAWQQQQETGDPETALVRAIAKVGTPCLLAAVTTSIGFLGMSVSELRAISELAYYTAFGIMCTFILSITLLVALASFGKNKKVKQAPKPTTQKPTRMVNFTSATSRFNHANSGLILVFSAIILALSAVGISKLKIDFNFLTEFKPSNQWRINTEKLNEEMGGLLSVVYVFDTEKAGGIKNPELLKQIDQAQALAKTMPVVENTISVADILKELNQAFHGGDKSWYKLPDSQTELAQLLLVYEVSGGSEIEDVLNFDRSKTAIQFRLKMAPASEVRAFIQAMDAHFEQNPVSSAKVEVSGIGLLWVVMADYISETQIKGYAIVFGLIALLMMVAFGSIKIGLLGMIPNLFPIVIVLGLMGWLDWHLDYMRLLMATIAIGIAVDDTIHMLSRIRSEFAATGSYKKAIDNSLATVGPALIATTVILVTAFLTFLMSGMAVMASFGILLACAITAALLADLYLLPAIILKLKPFGAEKAA